MQAGKLRHRVTLQRRVESQDATGAVVWTWTSFATVWASIEPLTGREYFAAAQVQSAIDARIRIRYLANVTAKMRVLHVAERGSPSLVTYYAVETVIDPEERGGELVLMVRQADADGFLSD